MHEAIWQVLARRGVLSAMLVVLVGTSCTTTKPVPPIADVRPHPMTIHGDTRVDDYYWLKNRESEDWNGPNVAKSSALQIGSFKGSLTPPRRNPLAACRLIWRASVAW